MLFGRKKPTDAPGRFPKARTLADFVAPRLQAVEDLTVQLEKALAENEAGARYMALHALASVVNAYSSAASTAPEVKVKTGGLARAFSYTFLVAETLGLMYCALQNNAAIVGIFPATTIVGIVIFGGLGGLIDDRIEKKSREKIKNTKADWVNAQADYLASLHQIRTTLSDNLRMLEKNPAVLVNSPRVAEVESVFTDLRRAFERVATETPSRKDTPPHPATPRRNLNP